MKKKNTIGERLKKIESFIELQKMKEFEKTYFTCPDCGQPFIRKMQGAQGHNKSCAGGWRIYAQLNVN